MAGSVPGAGGKRSATTVHGGGSASHTLRSTSRVPLWSPSLIEVKNVTMTGDGGHTFDWTCKMAGVHFHGHCDTIEVVRNARRVAKNNGIPSKFTWMFHARGPTTEVALEVEYELPLAILGRLAAPFLRRINEREAETMLTNLKDHLEQSRQAQPIQAVQVETRPTELRH